MKGQLFVGAALIFLAIIIALGITRPSIESFRFSEVERLANIEREFMFSASNGNVSQFSSYVRSDNQNSRAFYIKINTTGGNITLIAGNWMLSAQNLSIISDFGSVNDIIQDTQEKAYDLTKTTSGNAVLNVSYNDKSAQLNFDPFINQKMLYYDISLRNHDSLVAKRALAVIQ